MIVTKLSVTLRWRCDACFVGFKFIKMNHINPFAGSTDILISAIYKMISQLAISPYGLVSSLAVLAFIVVAAFSYLNMRLTHAFEEVD